MAPRQATYAGSVGTDGERERGRGTEREIKRESQERERRGCSGGKRRRE